MRGVSQSCSSALLDRTGTTTWTHFLRIALRSRFWSERNVSKNCTTHSGYAYDIAIQAKYKSEKKAAYCLTDPPLCVLRLCSQTVIVSQRREKWSPALSTSPNML